MPFRLRFVTVDLSSIHRSPMNANRHHRIATIVIALGLSLICPAQADEKVANPKVLHVLNRLSYGPRPGDVARVESIGIDRYIQQQLSPETIAESNEFALKIAQFKSLKLTPLVLLKTYSDRQKSSGPMVIDDRRSAKQISDEAMQANLLRSLESPRQLEAVMVNFWFNHFNVFVGKGRTRFLVGSYENQAIRPYALGRFRDLLGATAKHPAMLFYLDNWQNTAPGSPGAKGNFKGINENYARELMELHTIGVNGGYSQTDVVTLSKLLTGWGLARPNAVNSDPSGFYFDARRHDNSDKVFLGNAIPSGGQAEGERALDILARHPQTARFISYKLAQYFVSDQPSTQLIDRLATVYRESDGNIKLILTALFQSPEFWQAEVMNAKFKTPYEYAVSAVRATGQPVESLQPIVAAIQQLGMPIYGRQTPDGYPMTQTSWLNPTGIMQRVNFATTLGSGKLTVDENSSVIASRKTSPIDAIALRATLGNRLSPQTETVISQSAEKLRSALILGSPDFMWR
jgi:uncharacterized protein (DUF1800 family)